jgi:hypothetical protein
MTGASRPLRGRVLAFACAASYLYRLLGAALLALPVIGAIDASGVRDFSRGNARLFDPGGLYLLEVLLHAREQLAASLVPTLTLAAVLGFLGFVPDAGLLGALGSAPPPPRALERMLWLSLATWGARLLLGLLTVGLALTARSFFASARDERLPLLAIGVMLVIGVLLQVAVSFWHDLAAADVVAGGARARDAIFAALDLARASAGSLLVRFVGAQLLALGTLLAAAAVVGTLEVVRGDTWRSTTALFIHQLAVLATIGLRAAWLRGACRASERLRRA